MWGWVITNKLAVGSAWRGLLAVLVIAKTLPDCHHEMPDGDVENWDVGNWDGETCTTLRSEAASVPGGQISSKHHPAWVLSSFLLHYLEQVILSFVLTVTKSLLSNPWILEPTVIHWCFKIWAGVLQPLKSAHLECLEKQGLQGHIHWCFKIWAGFNRPGRYFTTFTSWNFLQNVVWKNFLYIIILKGTLE